MFLTFNGVSSQDYFKIQDVRRSILPPSQVKFLEVDGGKNYFISKRNGIKQIEVDIVFKSSSLEQLRKDVRNMYWLDSEEPMELVFSDESDKKDYAIISESTDLEEIVDIGFGTLTFLCENSYSIGTTGAATLTTSINVTPEGTHNVFPKFTIDFFSSTTEYKIEDDQGNFVRVTGQFDAGDQVVIDCNSGSVSLNGTVNMALLDYMSDFFEIKSTGTTLTAYPEFSADCLIEYENRWK